MKGQQPRLSLVTTETDFLLRNAGLEGALRENRCLEFASERVQRGVGQMDEMQWRFLEAAFLQNPRPRFLELLGYTDAGLKERAEQLLRPSLLSPGVDPAELSEKMQALLREKSQSPSSRSSSAQVRLIDRGRTLVDPQKKNLRSDHDPQKDPFNNSQRTIIVSTAPGRRCLMAWTACNVLLSAAAWGVLSA